jgi:hypothetical protein
MAHGCREATQITLELGTNVTCADMRGVEIVVAGAPHEAEHRAALDAPGTRFATATTAECTEGPAPRRIGTLVVTPSGGDGAVVVVAAFGNARPDDCIAPRFGPGCIVARRKFSFVDHTPVTLPIVLDPACAGVPCDENSTCVGAKCVTSKVDCASGTCTIAGQLPDGGLVAVDATSSLDGAPNADATSDAGDDASAGDGSVSDATVEGGVDASPDGGTCPALTTCIGSPVACAISDGTVACCYVGAGASCGKVGACAGLSGCCQSAEDCPTVGDVCCASTLNPTASTFISCRPRNECLALPGVAVCNLVGNFGCGQGHGCAGGTYSTTPQYYRCS